MGNLPFPFNPSLSSFHSSLYPSIPFTHFYTLLHTFTHFYTYLHTFTHIYTLLHIFTHFYTYLHTFTHFYTLLHYIRAPSLHHSLFSFFTFILSTSSINQYPIPIPTNTYQYLPIPTNYQPIYLYFHSLYYYYFTHLLRISFSFINFSIHIYKLYSYECFNLYTLMVSFHQWSHF